MNGSTAPLPDFLRQDADGVVFRIDPGVYGDRPILEALHRFTGRCFINTERGADGGLVCRVVPRVAGACPRELAGELANEILDQFLRQQLHVETEPIRRLILAQAFSRTDILHPEFDDADPKDDPAGIIAPDPPPRGGDAS